MIVEVKGLSVIYSESEGCESKYDDCGLGWRVLVVSTETVIGIKFLRQIDAVRAMEAIADFTNWTDVESVAEEIRGRHRELIMRMTECLAW